MSQYWVLSMLIIRYRLILVGRIATTVNSGFKLVECAPLAGLKRNYPLE